MSDPILRQFVGNKRKVQAKGGLHHIRGNRAPYFSLTMASWEPDQYGRLQEDCSGAAHEELVKLWPELKPLADLHLSDIDGVPSHGCANGWYWLVGATPAFHRMEEYHGGQHNRDWKTRDNACTQDEVARSFRIFCEHVRITPEETQALQADLINVYMGVDAYTKVYDPRKARDVVKPAFLEWAEAQKPRWKREADKCRADLGLVIYGDKYTEAGDK